MSWPTGGDDLRKNLEERLRVAAAQVESCDPDMLRFDVDGVVEGVVEKNRVAPIVVDWQGIERSQPREVTLAIEQWGERYQVPGQCYDFFVPASGNLQLLRLQASRFTLGPEPEFEYGPNQIRFSVSGRTLDAEQIRSRVDHVKSQITQRVEWVNSDIEQWLPSLERAARSAAESRKQRLEIAADVSDKLDIPIRSTSGQQQIRVPVTRKAVRVTERRLRPGVSAGPSEPRIDEAIYDDVVRTIRSVGNSFERLPQTAAKFKEPELRDLLLFILNSNYEGDARGEVFNGDGKTDILIGYRNRNAFIGECKIWRGERRFDAAIDQLASYTVWRDTKAALILFIKNRDATAVIATADRVIRAHATFLSARDASEPELRADYLLAARDDPSRRIQLALLPVVLRPPAVPDV